ncbi:g5052 [Coccomyxa elongata]
MAQPISNFGRVFAVYGGVFIVMSYGWGWLLSSERPDKGDFIGAGIAIGGVAIAWFWPRQRQAQISPSGNSAAQSVAPTSQQTAAA